MTSANLPKTHWEEIYQSKKPTEVSWYQTHLEKSLELIRRTGVSKEGSIIDIGGGSSTLIDDLLDSGFKHVAVLDVSSEALNSAEARLGKRAHEVTWIEADITQPSLPQETYDLWHDRALFHFLTSPDDRRKYVSQLSHALKRGGHAIISTFSINGPTRCSGLEIVRYSPKTMHQELGVNFILVESQTEKHQTPFGTEQEFIYCLFKKIN